MIAADTSSLSNFLKKAGTGDAELVKTALLSEKRVLSPVVIAELFSSARMSDQIESAIEDIPVLELKPGFGNGLERSEPSFFVKARKLDLPIA